MFALIGTGHPAIPTGDFDFTPLLYAAILLLAYRRTRLPLRLWVIPAALVLGGLIDSISDGLHHTTLTTASALIVVAILLHPRLLHPRGRPAMPDGPPDV
jgi:hypothetical protein